MRSSDNADVALSWRAIVLYGLNTATYKIALGRALQHLARAGHDRVPMPDLTRSIYPLRGGRLGDRLARGVMRAVDLQTKRPETENAAFLGTHA